MRLQIFPLNCAWNLNYFFGSSLLPIFYHRQPNKGQSAPSVSYLEISFGQIYKFIKYIFYLLCYSGHQLDWLLLSSKIQMTIFLDTDHNFRTAFSTLPVFPHGSASKPSVLVFCYSSTPLPGTTFCFSYLLLRNKPHQNVRARNDDL